MLDNGSRGRASIAIQLKERSIQISLETTLVTRTRARLHTALKEAGHLWAPNPLFPNLNVAHIRQICAKSKLKY